ncbi:disease resistance-responsive (dirigent-likeprotein) family protein [Striga asiatica]|uniref:Dirigent protein n=1 Tax=Striga asiatica TaxID=4170 RepID=A0A5A7QYT6_STRAF|nr:disease resistance-responsive (dirigent-likeprotein) family protein [Striga asiatica]
MIMPEANGFGEKFTQLQLYVQDMLHGPTPTPINVAMANSTPSSPTFFGLVAVLDDPVRTGPSLDAEIVGRAQGMIVFASIAETSIHMTFDLVFTGGEYNGSTLNVQGRNPYLRDYREISIVGGTGGFRLARGHIGVNTVSINSTSGDAFFHYNITVLHY